MTSNDPSLPSDRKIPRCQWQWQYLHPVEAGAFRVQANTERLDLDHTVIFGEIDFCLKYFVNPANFGLIRFESRSRHLEDDIH